MTKKEEAQKQEHDRKFLKELKEKINAHPDFSCDYPTDEDLDHLPFPFIWIRTKDELIGNITCHYEVIFNDPKEGNHDVASVEVHFEDDNFKDFQNIKLPDCLAYYNWYDEHDRRIIYKDKDSEYNNSHRKIIDRLMELDRLIGVDLRNALCRKLGGQKRDTLMREALLETRAFLKKPERAEKAIEAAEYTCECCDNKQKTFTTDNGREYMEAHLLIPMTKNTDFDDSLDQPANIVCLCPSCHREIHHGVNRVALAEKLWNRRKTKLKAAGIGITWSKLKEYYS